MTTKNSFISKYVWVFFLFLVINTILNILLLFREDGAIMLEKLKAGGEKNFNAIMEFYTSDAYIQQQAKNIPLLLQQMQNTAKQQGVSNESANMQQKAEASQPNPTIQQAIQTIKRNGYIAGNKNARFTILEYSDIECPFCKRHHQNGTIKSLLNKYPDQVNHIFRHFPLAFHPHAQMAAEATECVASLKNNSEKAFYAMIAELFKAGSLSKDTIISAGNTIGVSKKQLEKCLENGTFTQKVKDQMNEGQNLFGISGTPGNVIVDTQTGKFVVIPGAMPLEAFEQKLQELMNG